MNVCSGYANKEECPVCKERESLYIHEALPEFLDHFFGTISNVLLSNVVLLSILSAKQACVCLVSYRSFQRPFQH